MSSAPMWENLLWAYGIVACLAYAFMLGATFESGEFTGAGMVVTLSIFVILVVASVLWLPLLCWSGIQRLLGCGDDSDPDHHTDLYDFD